MINVIDAFYKKNNHMTNEEEMKKQYNELNDMLGKINKMSQHGGCIICLENTHSNKCKHVLSV
jgi:hypothetical protein